MKNKKNFSSDFNFLLIIVLGIAVTFFLLEQCYGREVELLRLDDQTVAQIHVTPRGTALEFPIKPEHVVLGQAKSFGLEYIKNDVIVSPLRSDARSNLFVYLMGHRFTFDLISSLSGGRTIVIIRDRRETQVKIYP